MEVYGTPRESVGFRGSKPTRNMGITATLIDNIFCYNISSEISLAGIFYCNITDHYPVFHIEQGQMNEQTALDIEERNYSEKKHDEIY